jgi:branched-chain amino acid transport system substrate-binding protein
MRRHLSLIFGVALAAAWSGVAASDIPIGFANPLTGPLHLSGERNHIAVEMAVQDLNAQGGVLGQKVRLVPVDDACGMKRAIAAARRLVEADVRVVIGHLCSHSSLLPAGIYEVADVLMISPSSTHPRLTEEGRQNVFRLNGRDDEQGRLAGNFLASRFADKRIAILHDGSTYGEGLAEEARKQLRARGVIEAMYGTYPPNSHDYSELLTRLRKARIDVLYVGGYGPDAGLMLRTARERGDDLRLIGGDGLAMEGFWAVAGKMGEGAIFSHRPDVRERPVAAKLLARFRERGMAPRLSGFSTYAAVEVWAQAVERAGSLQLSPVAEALRRGHFDTVLGRVGFDYKGDLEDAAFQWKVWADGDYVPLDKFAAH